MQLLNADSIFGIKLQHTEVEVIGIGTFLIRELTGKQRDEFEYQAQIGQKKGNDFRDLRSKLIINSLCDSNGELLFSIADLQKVNDMSSRVITALFNAIMNFNGMNEYSIEVAEKNSENTQPE